MQKIYSRPVVVAMNRFATDTQEEIQTVMQACSEAGAQAIFTDVFLKGGAGGEELAKAVLEKCENKESLTYAYELGDDVKTKIQKIVCKVYGGDGVTYSERAEEALKEIASNGVNGLPVIIAKTQYSLSDDAKKLARPQGFTVHVRDVVYKGGAGFIVAIAGDIMLMPGLGKVPCAEKIDIDENGVITGLS